MGSVKMKKLIIGGLLGLVSAFSYADLKCANLKSQSEINQCASKRVSVLDGQIGGIYQKYLQELTSSEQAQLKISQRLWVQFKEKDCAFEASPVKNGSMYSYTLAACLAERTEKRMNELENMMNCKKGTEPSCL